MIPRISSLGLSGAVGDRYYAQLKLTDLQYDWCRISINQPNLLLRSLTVTEKSGVDRIRQ